MDLCQIMVSEEEVDLIGVIDLQSSSLQQHSWLTFAAFTIL